MNELRQKNRSYVAVREHEAGQCDRRGETMSYGCCGSSNLIAPGPAICYSIEFWNGFFTAFEQRLNTQGLRLLQHRRRRALNALKRAKQRSAAKGIVLDEQADWESVLVISEDFRGHLEMRDLLVFQCTM